MLMLVKLVPLIVMVATMIAEFSAITGSPITYVMNTTIFTVVGVVMIVNDREYYYSYKKIIESGLLFFPLLFICMYAVLQYILHLAGDTNAYDDFFKAIALSGACMLSSMVLLLGINLIKLRKSLL